MPALKQAKTNTSSPSNRAPAGNCGPLKYMLAVTGPVHTASPGYSWLIERALFGELMLVPAVQLQAMRRREHQRRVVAVRGQQVHERLPPRLVAVAMIDGIGHGRLVGQGGEFPAGHVLRQRDCEVVGALLYQGIAGVGR